MSKKISYIITDANISVNFDNQTHIVPRTDALADQLIAAMKEERINDIPMLVSTAKRLETYSKGNFVVQDGAIMVNGMAAPAALSSKILRFMNEGLPYKPLIKFAENLMQNPSFRSVNELFQFLEKNDHPITEDGCFIAYKKVREDFKDVHSGKFDNSPGQVVSMARNQVNEDSNQTCSYGLHVANWEYAVNFYGGGVMLEVEVNPADVVAVPSDYNQSKMRVCKYKVLGVVDREHSSDVALRIVHDEGPEPEVDVTEEFSTCSDCGVVTDDDCDLCEDCEMDGKDEYPWESELEE